MFNGTSPLVPQPVDYLFTALVFVAVILLIASVVVFLRQPRKAPRDLWILVFLIMVPVIAPVIYLRRTLPITRHTR